MKKNFILIFLILFYVYNSTAEDFIDRFNISGKKPEIHKIEYLEESQKIIADCEYADLTINFSDENKCVVNIQTDNSKFETVCSIKKDMLEGIYHFNLNKTIPCLLICYYAEDATGLSANIMKALLIKLYDKKNELIQLSTFGSVYKNFIDTNNDGTFEFICIDLFYNPKTDDERFFIANYFILSDEIKNISDKTQLKMIGLYNGEIVVKKQNDINYKLLTKPSIF